MSAAPPDSHASPLADQAHARGLRRAAWAFAAALVLITWVAVAALLRSQYLQALEGDAQQNANLARALAEQSHRVLAAVDQATLRVGDAVRDGQALPELARFANETGLAPHILVQLSLVGPDGRFEGSNLDPDGSKTGHVDLTEREHIKVHLAPAAAADGRGLFVGKPVLGKVSRRWTIQLSRALRAADGRLLGVAVASLDPGYFEDVFRGVALGEQGGVSLVGSDLAVRARVVGGVVSGMGSQLATDGPFARRASAQEGSAIGASTVDGVRRVLAWRQVGDYPLHVVVFTGTEGALAAWREARSITVALAGLLSLAVLTAAAVFTGSLRRLEAGHEALRRSESQAQSANRAKSEFLAAISHELRTPLTSIRGFAELMEHRLDKPRDREQAGLIRKNAEHLNTLLTEILDLAKAEAGVMPVRAAPEPLAPLLQATADFFAMSAGAKSLTLALEMAPDLPQELVCDALRLKQVLNNLLSNAVKFTEQGGIRLRVEAGPAEVLFQVIDTGPGIAADKQALVFEKFRQGDDRVSYQHGGTGLGLALSRELAERMGGRLTLRSEPGQGACFTLALPR